MSSLDNINVRDLISKIKKSLFIDNYLLSFDELFDLQVKRIESFKEKGVIQSYIANYDNRTIDIFLLKPNRPIEYITLNYTITQTGISFEDVMKEL